MPHQNSKNPNSNEKSGLKLLLTSAGVNNHSIHHALVDMLDKPIEDCTALCIPTAMYGHPWVGPGVKAWEFITGNAENPMVNLGWKSVGILELTALPSIGKERWVPLVKETDVLLVSGGDALFLNHWMRESGLAELLPSLNAVYVGMSAGSMVMAPKIGEEFIGWLPPAGGDAALGLVDFAMFPHLGHELLPDNTLENAEKWAEGVSVPGYAIDDHTAIKVSNGEVEVISEGQWKRFNL
ncbi:Type 1 glutamine amidotransferase-like domain-containing protein [Jeotgalibacillus sp. ET6]|uniref:Type 1 glutamine amidotransferase-like domain-containing protein n=1 Tax=Jeotgalibacillus sp. ET6 TaxID=3037260 RepID=UPI002418196B|nr:Type 1 glutamine amidotransferase-like domain-containing protein [Jeotgalibacillus sp. ET6]MDG5473140.1 Type 1 glutamine amidotransferase-like domain-containing protein [Jeotgalibacillus sp. ET6]